MEKKKVLFLPTGNTARSQMAEGLLRHHAGDRFEALSDGLEPRGLNPLAVEVMREIGIDISGQESKGIDRRLSRKTIHYAVFVCGHAEENCPVAYGLALNRLPWRMPDPAAVEGTREEKPAAFRAARDELDRRIRDWLEERGTERGLFRDVAPASPALLPEKAREQLAALLLAYAVGDLRTMGQAGVGQEI